MSKKILTLMISALLLVPFGFSREIVFAEEENAEMPLGIFTKISVSIYGGDGRVWATAKNDFTLFPSTVQVYVELYYSSEYHESYKDMILAERNYIYDLDQGHTIQAYGSTNGETLYWAARARYKADESEWREVLTDVIRCDGAGIMIQ